MPHQIKSVLRKCIKLGADIMKQKAPATLSDTFDRRWRSHFGCSPEICSKLWLILAKCDQVSMKSLLWVLFFLKTYPTESEACSRVGGIDEKAWREKIWELINNIALLEAKMVSVSFLSGIIHVYLLTSISIWNYSRLFL